MLKKIYIKNAKAKLFETDTIFNSLYPIDIQALAKRHWTPIDVAKTAADFLAIEPNTKILDIGSGVGKFCLTAAFFHPKNLFFGIEQRKKLVDIAKQTQLKLGLENVCFIEGNVMEINFSEYHHFYFYNSFFENIAGTEKIDDEVSYSLQKFNSYNIFLYKQLQKKPVGTRLVTFHSLENEVPSNFMLVEAKMDNLLKFWIKTI
ncbi:methyltransferase domain-containing protein [Hydrotalea sp.]|uniref:methyltransferase domain-containing protein n=1 Tax=Hydrotalea sp. TaxID=2881279 RepID=UPI003D0A784B